MTVVDLQIFIDWGIKGIPHGHRVRRRAERLRNLEKAREYGRMSPRRHMQIDGRDFKRAAGLCTTASSRAVVSAQYFPCGRSFSDDEPGGRVMSPVLISCT